MTDLNCSLCGGSGLVWRTVKSKFGAKTVSANIQEWCPRCNAPRRAAERKQRRKDHRR